jgi:hypothetical protein
MIVIKYQFVLDEHVILGCKIVEFIIIQRVIELIKHVPMLHEEYV